VAENARDVVMLHDAEGNTLWASPSVAEVFGRTPEQVCTLSVFDVIHPEDVEAVHDHHAALINGTNRGPITYRVRHADGHYVWMETLVQAIYDGGVLTRIQSSSRDVTEQVARNRELKRAKQDAEEADHLKSALLANMSHEIRTPLTAIIGFAEVLKEELGSSTHHQRFATLIHDSSRRLMQTLDSVLQLSKLEAGIVTLNSEPINLAAEVLDTVELLRPHAEARGVDLQMTADPSLPNGEWDDGAMHRIVQNLVGNAIKFTEDGGAVRVEVQHDGDHARIVVSDTGIGIDDAFLSDIFEPFRQESAGMGRSHEGSGLGLAIVRRLVEVMDGTISVDSEKGVGTTFTVRLPLTRRPAASPQDESGSGM
jgi:PAS domain S-box-containing protein